MRFYYRIPDVVETEMPFDGKSVQEKQDIKPKSSAKADPPEKPLVSSPKSDLERNKQVLSAANLPVETEEKILKKPIFKPIIDSRTLDTDINCGKPPLSSPAPVPAAPKSVIGETSVETTDTKIDVTPAPVKVISENVPVVKPEENGSKSVPPINPTVNNKSPPQKVAQVPAKEIPSSLPTKSQKEEAVTLPQNIPKVSKQDELPVEVLLSLSTCRVGKEASPKRDLTTSVTSQMPKAISAPKTKHSSNARMSLNKIANELQQKAANNFIQKTSKENTVSPTKDFLFAARKISPSKSPGPNKTNNHSNAVNGKVVGNKRKNNGIVGPGRHFFNDNNKSISVMDQRIQQLYKFPGSPGNGVVQVGQKTESRLASWLNNRFQTKPPGSPSHPGITSSTPILPNNLSNQLTVSTKINGSKPSENSPGVNFALQSAIDASIKATAHPVPAQMGLFNKRSSVNNDLPPSSITNGKATNDKREKSKLTPILPNGISIKKDIDHSKEASPKSSAVVNQKRSTAVQQVSTAPSSPKVDDGLKTGKLLNDIKNVSSSATFAKDPGLIIPEPSHKNSHLKDNPEVSGPPNGLTPLKSPKPILAKDDKLINGQSASKPSVNNTTDAVENAPTSSIESKRDDSAKKHPENKGDPTKLDEEVNRLKRKLEEMRKMSNVKGKELGGCQITHENPDPEEVKRRRDLTPVVSIELMRGCKRPVPGLKAIQDIVDLGKRKTLDEKKDHQEKKLKLSTIKKEVAKKEESCALDLSRCGPPNPPTPPHPWFNPLLHQQFLPSPK